MSALTPLQRVFNAPMTLATTRLHGRDDQEDGYAGSVEPSPLPARSLSSTVARIAAPVGMAAGTLCLALAPFTAGLSLIPVAASTPATLTAALGLMMTGRVVSRMFTRRSAEGENFSVRLKLLEHQIQNPDSLAQPFALTPNEETMLGGLIDTPGVSGHLRDVFDGAYVRINDGGKLYDQWSQMEGVKERISSHASDGKQYEMDGRLTGPMLFGRTKDGHGTWVQMERDSGEVNLKSIASLPAHLQDYVQYKITHRNQSRYGTSQYTDKNPLVFTPR